jgi:dinuclear metal center YbgI/SA1388 family protein
MTTAVELAADLDALLEAARFREEEPENGLIVDAGRPATRLGAAVNTSFAAIERAAEMGVDLLLVHHPSWSHIDQRTHAPKLARLRELGISLYGAHASLDAAPRFGTGDALARLIGLTTEGRFVDYLGGQAGVYGSWDGSLDDLATAVAGAVGGEPEVHRNLGRCKRVAIVPGGGGMTSWLEEALTLGCDTYLTGEGSIFTRLFAREAGLDLVLAGHYRTELPGIVALTELAAERHGLDWLVVEDEPVG